MICNINFELKLFKNIQNYWDNGNEFNLQPNAETYLNKTKEDYYSDGWRKVIAPDYNMDIEYLGDLFYDSINDVVTLKKVNFTQEELDKKEIINTDSDQSSIKLKKSIEDGKLMYQRFFADIQRLLDKGTITGNQAKNSVMLLWNPLLPINYGQFIVSKLILESLTPPINAKELAIFNKAKEHIDNYLK